MGYWEIKTTYGNIDQVLFDHTLKTIQYFIDMMWCHSGNLAKVSNRYALCLIDFSANMTEK